MTAKLKYIGHAISLTMLKDYIKELDMGNGGRLLLNPFDFNSLATEYKETFHENIPTPYTVLNVAVEKDNEGQIPHGSIGIT